MVCCIPGDETNAESIRNFIIDPGVDMITGKRRSGQADLLDIVRDVILSVDPSASIIRIDDAEDVERFRNSVSEGSVTTGYVLIDGAKNTFPVMDIVGELPFSVFYTQELCHQVPICKKLRQK